MKTIVTWVTLLATGMFVGILVGRGCAGSNDPHAGHNHSDTSEAAVKFWTCSMHPQIQRPGPGACPLCGMDLIPVSDDTGEEELGPRELKLSQKAESLAEVEVIRAERRYVTQRIPMVGKVEYDETRVANITAWVPGRLDRLYVDYTGIEVKQGDHMVYLYSPELLAAQEELIQAKIMISNLEQSESTLIKDRARATLEASREKLRLLGLTEQQISATEAKEQPDDHITIYSPISGVVIHKAALEGQYVSTGSSIYTVADLSRLWVQLDAYESDLTWLHYGQPVEFVTEAYPGETFRGTIAFIDPMLNPRTRTVKVRVNVDNPDGKLKPYMFVRATVSARIARGGNVYAPELAGKWISPMHPEVVKNEPGSCDVCGMPLVSAESLGYVMNGDEEAPLVIPATAPLITGRRAVVYVRDPDRRGVYEGREITLGPRAGTYYLVEDGLSEGELVVHRGNFKIDSAMQIMAKPSMMNPEGGGPTPGHHHAGPTTGADEDHAAHAEPVSYPAPTKFKQSLDRVFEAYVSVSQAMAADDAAKVKTSVQVLRTELDEVDMSLLEGDGHIAWMKQVEAMIDALSHLSAEDIEVIRRGLRDLSATLLTSVKSFGLGRQSEIFVHHCPMAFGGEGADWLQADDQTHNPYFSGGMLRCGMVRERVSASTE